VDLWQGSVLLRLYLVSFQPVLDVVSVSNLQQLDLIVPPADALQLFHS
jgi:hypothetical protein